MTALPTPLKTDVAPTFDRLLDGRVLLRQARRGHRAGTDALLLSAMVPAGIEGLIVDVGAGTGAVGISIGVRMPALRLALVENEPAAAALARGNLALNGLEARSRVCELDVLSFGARREAGLADGCAAVVVTNPPFYDAGSVRVPADAARAHAHVLPAPEPGAPAPLAEWIGACLSLLAPRGRLALIHRPAKLLTILATLEGRAGSVRVTPVHPHAASDATRILVAATKGSRGAPALTPALVLHEPDGSFTRAAEALHRGYTTL